MKKIRSYLFFVLISSSVSCIAQKRQEKPSLHFNAWSYIDSSYLGIFSFSNEDDGSSYEVAVPYYDFTTEEIKIGQACLFAISKDYPEDWIADTEGNECNEKEDFESIALCQAKNLFSSDTTTLKEELDLYLFLISKEELEGPFVEEAEGGKVYNYYPVRGSTFFVYKFISSNWEEVDRIKQKGDNIPRFFGADYMKQIALEKIAKYTNK